MSDRKAELERKKAKLEAMRQEKKRKEEEKKKTREGGDVSKPMGGSVDLRTETAAMLDELLGPSETSGPRLVSSHSVPGPSSPLKRSDDSTVGEPAATAAQLAARRKVQLGLSKTTQTNIAPKELVQYEKETQTPQENQSSADENRPKYGQYWTRMALLIKRPQTMAAKQTACT